MSEEQTVDNKWKYILAGGSLIAVSFVGYYFWKRNKATEDKTSEQTIIESLKLTEKKNKEYLDFYHINGKLFHTNF
jgi:hypothetical protein